MPKKKYSFKLKSNLSELDRLCEHLDRFGQSAGLSKKSIFEINLALDELFTNIISYGFPDDDEHVIEVTITPQNETLCMCIEARSRIAKSGDWESISSEILWTAFVMNVAARKTN
jgi:serine/threonine-protein kinase RsbW